MSVKVIRETTLYSYEWHGSLFTVVAQLTESGVTGGSVTGGNTLRLHDSEGNGVVLDEKSALNLMRFLHECYPLDALGDVQ
jgi:hypothetical protein